MIKNTSLTEGVIRVTEEFYKELYATKPSKDSAREKILNCLNKRITPRAITKLSTSITINEMKITI